MTSVNTPEEQAIAFLLTCVENSQKGKINWDNVSLDIGVNMTAEAAKYYFSIVKNAKEFDRSDKYPEIHGDPSWQHTFAWGVKTNTFESSLVRGHLQSLLVPGLCTL